MNRFADSSEGSLNSIHELLEVVGDARSIEEAQEAEALNSGKKASSLDAVSVGHGDYCKKESDFSTLPKLIISPNMNFSSDLALSDEYQSFRSTVPLKKIAVDADTSKVLF